MLQRERERRMYNLISMFRRIQHIIIPLGCFLCLFLASIHVVFAEPFVNPLIYDELKDLLGAIVKTAVYILTPIVTLAVVYTGFLFVQAQGNPAKLSEARMALMWCLIGGVIILGAAGISSAIQGTVNNIVPSTN